MQSELTRKQIQVSNKYSASTGEIEKSVLIARDSSLMDRLEKTIRTGLTFGEYIYPYLYENSEGLRRDHPDYKMISSDEYYKYLKGFFTENGLKGRGSLNPQNSIRLDQKKKVLEKRGMEVSREDMFLLAFGLRMHSSLVSVFLKSVLLQSDFNPKDYREVIYYWCLKQSERSSSAPYVLLQEWMSFYNGITEKTTLWQGRPVTEETRTQYLSLRLDKIKTKFEMQNYLICLKRAEFLNPRRRTMERLYWELRQDLPHRNVPFKKRDNLKNENSADRMFCNPAIRSSVEDVIAFREESFPQYSVNQLPSKEILQEVFSDLEFSEKAIWRRERGEVPIGRKEILLFEFLIFTYDLYCDAEDKEFVTTDWKEKYRSFCDTIEQHFLECGMETRLNFSHPFELFLIICLRQKSPFTYFLACWEYALSASENHGDIHSNLAYFTETGGRRENEDFFCVEKNENGLCAVLADGLGGQGGGKRASQQAVCTIRDAFRKGKLNHADDVSRAAEISHMEICKLQSYFEKMMTTLVVLRISGNTIFWGHCGDSRLYFFLNGRIQKQTLDHSVSQMMVMMGEISESDIRTHCDRNRILRALGSSKPELQMADSMHWDYDCNHSVLMCTDGFWEYVLEKEMEECLAESSTAEEWLDRMHEIVLSRAPQNRDNCSAIVIWQGRKREEA